jgi:hypothetical protein
MRNSVLSLLGIKKNSDAMKFTQAKSVVGTKGPFNTNA